MHECLKARISALLTRSARRSRITNTSSLYEHAVSRHKTSNGDLTSFDDLPTKALDRPNFKTDAAQYCSCSPIAEMLTHPAATLPGLPGTSMADTTPSIAGSAYAER